MMSRPAKDPIPELRTMAGRIFSAALVAADPQPMVRRLISVRGRTVVLDGNPFDIGSTGRVIVLAAGKAAVPMARAAEQLLGPLMHKGLAVTIEGHGMSLERVPLRVAGHPLPDQRSVAAAYRMLQLAESAKEGDLVLCLLSGGSSSLLTAPAPPLTLGDLCRITVQLIESGADIHQLNSVRKHLSAIKGGQLARAAWPSAQATLLLSDVVGNLPEVIASGPTAPDPSRFGEALTILETFGLLDLAPPAVLERLRSGAAGEIEETPGPDDPCFRYSLVRVAGSNRDAMVGAAAEARRLGFRVVVRPEPLIGEARAVAALFGERLQSLTRTGGSSPICFISGGETTVTLPARHGLGGRNMELALAAVPILAKYPGALLFSAGTDGIDGPTPAAGAIIDSGTLGRAGRKNLDFGSFLENHDSYHFFRLLGDLVVTGPTNTNVMDLQILLVDPH